MIDQPSVSIFIVTRLSSAERCDILRLTCEAALAQRYRNFEVVVSENPGDFRAEDALSSIQDERLTVVRNEEDRGFNGNINRCLELCSYDIIKPICDDDLIHPDFLSHTVPLVDDDTLVVTGAEKYNIGCCPADMSQQAEGPFEIEIRPAGYGADIWSLNYPPFPSAMLFTRKLFSDLGRYDEASITADWDFFIEACLYHKIAYINHTLCHGGVWGGSLTEILMDQPFFFPLGGLYTRFRVYHCKPLSAKERRNLLRILLKEFFLQTLRPLKHPFRRTYWAGYSDYAGCFFRLWRTGKKAFAARSDVGRSQRGI